MWAKYLDRTRASQNTRPFGLPKSVSPADCVEAVHEPAKRPRQPADLTGY